MAFLYGLLRGWVGFLRRLAVWKHSRAKRSYERLENAFEELERDCKTHEVRMGRPVDYGAQLRLLKAFEAKEQARLAWVRSANKMNSRQAWDQRVRRFSGKKLPYTFGLLDMAALMQALDYLPLPYRMNLATLEALWQAWL
jgi:hypothetical protein